MNKEFFKLLEEIEPNKFDMVYSSPNGMTVLKSSEYGFRLDQIHELKRENFILQARADKYKCRIDKAIKCIKEYKEWGYSKYYENEIEIELIDKILEMLEGGENNK